MRLALAILIALTLPAQTTAAASPDLCPIWASGPWSQEIGAREHELHNRGCEQRPDRTWRASHKRCARAAYRLAARGLAGSEIGEAMRAGCRQDDDGSWR